MRLNLPRARGRAGGRGGGGGGGWWCCNLKCLRGTMHGKASYLQVAAAHIALQAGLLGEIPRSQPGRTSSRHRLQVIRVKLDGLRLGLQQLCAALHEYNSIKSYECGSHKYHFENKS